MKHKLQITIAIILTFVVAIQAVVNANVKQSDQLIAAFSATNPVPVEAIISVSGYFGSMNLNNDQKIRMVKNLANKLDICDDYEITQNICTDCTQTELSKELSGTSTKIQLIELRNVDQHEQEIVEQYFYVTVKLQNNIDHVLRYRDEIVKTMAEIGIHAECNLYLEGEIDGKKTLSEMNQIAEAFLANMDAKKVSQTYTDQTFVVYGYTKNEKEAVFQNGQEINVNLAITYDENAQKTHIHMAVPYIEQCF